MHGIEDPTMRAEAQANLVQQDKTVQKFGNDYQVTLKALKTDAKLIAKDSLEGASTLLRKFLACLWSKTVWA